MDSDYTERLADQELRERLETSGGILIEGPRAVGKTKTARQAAASEVLLDVDASYRELAAIEPAAVLEGEVPRLIDEWQLEPAIWNHVRRVIDDRGKPGQFILTGSASPADDVTRHSGAGRISRMRMRPMSLFESGVSSGEMSLAALLDGQKAIARTKDLPIADVAAEIVAGGWPGLRERSSRTDGRAMREYLDEIARLDLDLPDAPRHDPARVKRLLRSLARNVATQTSIATLARDSGDKSNPALAEDSVRAYLSALRRIFIVEDQPAWGPHLRSRYRLRTSPKLHFVDPSLAASALRATSRALTRDLNLLGLLFESLVIRDLRIYAQAADAHVLHYRDEGELEADAIVEHADGRWAAFEVKLGHALVEDGAESLKRLVKRVDTRKCGEPAALGVIVPSGLGYRREDGIHVIPLIALGP